MKFKVSYLACVVITLATTPTVRVEIRKKLTLLVGNPDRTATNLLTGWAFIYLAQFTNKNGRAIVEVANAQLQITFRVFIHISFAKRSLLTPPFTRVRFARRVQGLVRHSWRVLALRSHRRHGTDCHLDLPR